LDLEVFNSLRWALLTQKQQSNVLHEAMVFYILSWWNNETRFNPNKHDATKDCIALKVDEQHVTQLLLEIQVNKVFFNMNLDL
jgi:hypothetical protein